MTTWLNVITMTSTQESKSTSPLTVLCLFHRVCSEILPEYDLVLPSPCPRPQGPDREPCPQGPQNPTVPISTPHSRRNVCDHRPWPLVVQSCLHSTSPVPSTRGLLSQNHYVVPFSSPSSKTRTYVHP